MRIAALQRSAPDRGGARLLGVCPPSRSRPPACRRWVSSGAPRSPRPSPPVSCRRSSATPPVSSTRCAAAASRSRASAGGTSARLTARGGVARARALLSRSRWRREGFGRPGRTRVPGSPWSWIGLACGRGRGAPRRGRRAVALGALVDRSPRLHLPAFAHGSRAGRRLGAFRARGEGGGARAVGLGQVDLPSRARRARAAFPRRPLRRPGVDRRARHAAEATGRAAPGDRQRLPGSRRSGRHDHRVQRGGVRSREHWDASGRDRGAGRRSAGRDRRRCTWRPPRDRSCRRASSSASAWPRRSRCGPGLLCRRADVAARPRRSRRRSSRR